MNLKLSDKNFRILLISIYAIMGVWIVLNHEMWRDEMQSWLYAKYSTNALDIYQNKIYEGQPILWFWLVYLSYLIYDHWIMMQLLHVLISCIALWIFIKYAPFNRLIKVLFAGGYYMLFEYLAISRCYSLGLLFIFAICALYPNREKYILYISLLLSLLTQTSVYGLMFSLLFGFRIFSDYFSIFYAPERKLEVNKKIVYIGLFLVLLGVLFSIIQMIPPTYTSFTGGWRFDSWNRFVFKDSISRFWVSFFPFPEAKVAFWNTNIIPGGDFLLIISILLYFVASAFFLHHRRLLLIFAGGAFLIMAFFYLKYYGAIRHHGHLYILWITCLWLRHYEKEKPLLTPFILRIKKGCVRAGSILLYLTLVVQFAAGIFAYVVDIRYPFSAGKETAEWILEKDFDKDSIIGHADFRASTVVGYLGQEVFYPSIDKNGSFIQFEERRKNFQDSLYLENLCLLPDSIADKILLMWAPDMLNQHCSMRKVFTSQQCIAWDEQFFLYRLK